MGAYSRMASFHRNPLESIMNHLQTGLRGRRRASGTGIANKTTENSNIGAQQLDTGQRSSRAAPAAKNVT